MKILVTIAKWVNGSCANCSTTDIMKSPCLTACPGKDEAPSSTLSATFRISAKSWKQLWRRGGKYLAAIHNPNIATASVTYPTNVVGTFNVHHAAFRLGIKRVVSASSNAIVGWSYCDRFVPDYLDRWK